MQKITGQTIKTLREKKGLTQKELGNLISVSDKTVSKWETGKGLPDMTMLEPLCKVLGLSASEFLCGEHTVNKNRSGNILKSSFYVCPECGNIIYAVGQGSFCCCGVNLKPLHAAKAEFEHEIKLEQVEYDYFVTMDHPMTKEHYITFFAYINDERVEIVKQYPEQNAQCRFPMKRMGKIYACCNRHGMFEIKL